MTKISALSDIGTSVASNDTFVLVDVSDPTTPNKKIQQQNLFLIPDGSAGTPAVRFLNDTDVGLFRPTTNTLALATGGSERLRIDSSGRVGIGTTSPGAKLTVVEGTANTSMLNLVGLNNYIHEFQNRDAGNHLRFYINSGSPTWSWASNATEFARIDSSGRLLVGTSTSRAVGGAAAGDFQIEVSGSKRCATFVRNGGTSILTLGSTGATGIGNTTILANNAGLGAIEFAGADGTDLQTLGASISAEVDGTPGANDMPGRLVFSTTADGASSPTERMRLNSLGQLLVGTSSALNSADRVSISGQLAAGGQTMAALSKSVDVGNTVTFDITGSLKVLASVRIIVGYVGNNSYQMHAQYEYVSCNSGTTGATATQVGVLQVEAGNAQFNYSDITVSRPSSATVRITYAPTSGLGTHTPTVYVNGVFASLT